MRISKKYKAAVCIPTLNEADSISNTTQMVDNGLKSIFHHDSYIIVNADNKSTDATREHFLETATSCRKLSVSTKPRGKGENLIRFLYFCQQQGIEYAATIDADIKTIETDWVPKLITPLLDGSADYVSPLYLRNRFEGNTTNHFAMPLVFSFFGQIIRQPIGGEFAFNAEAVNIFLSRKIITETRGYGIDMFLTTHAVGSGLRISQIRLGRKIHKPSWPKIITIFREEFISALHSLNRYEPCTSLIAGRNDDSLDSIDSTLEFQHKQKLAGFRTEMLDEISRITKSYRLYLKANLIEDITESGEVSAKQWAEIMGYFLASSFKNKFGPEKIRRYADLITPLFILRTISYLLECEKMKIEEVESEIIQQARLIRKNLLAHLRH